MKTIGRNLLACAALPMASLFVACGDDDDPTGPGPGNSDFEWSGEIAPGLAIEIKGISGGIIATGTSGDDTEVFANKSGDQSDPATVTIEVVQHDGGVTICAVYPDVVGQPPNECVPGPGGNMTNGDNDVEVTFAVSVPSDVEFVGRTVAGNVDATSLSADAYANVVSGNIDIATSGMAEASTVSGSVDVTIGETDPDRDLTFSAVSGNVTVGILSATNAEIRATVVTGNVFSDFPLTETSPGVWEGTLGSGGQRLSLSTVTGTVDLRSRD